MTRPFLTLRGMAMALGVAFLYDCSGAASNVPSGAHIGLPESLAAPYTLAKVPVRIVIPSPTKGTGARRRAYISPGTESITVTLLTANGQSAHGAPTIVPTAVGGSNCAPSLGGRTCSGTVNGALGDDVFTVTTNGTLSGAETLASGTVPLAAVTAANPPTLLLTAVNESVLSPVVKLVATLTPATLPIGAPGTAVLTINEEDPSGSIFVGPRDFPQPLAVTLGGETDAITATLPPLPGTPAAPQAINYGMPISISNSDQLPITLSYDGSGAVLGKVTAFVGAQNALLGLQTTTTLSFSGAVMVTPKAAPTHLYVLYFDGGAPLSSSIVEFDVAASGTARPISVIPLNSPASAIAVDIAGNIWVNESAFGGPPVDGLFPFIPLFGGPGYVPSSLVEIPAGSTTVTTNISGGSDFLPGVPYLNDVAELPLNNGAFARTAVWTDAGGNVFTTGMSSITGPFGDRDPNGCPLGDTLACGYAGFGEYTATQLRSAARQPQPVSLQPASIIDTTPSFTDAPVILPVFKTEPNQLMGAAVDLQGYSYLAGRACPVNADANCTDPIGAHIDVFPPNVGLEGTVRPNSVRHITSISPRTNLQSTLIFKGHGIFNVNIGVENEPVYGLAIDDRGHIFASQYHTDFSGSIHQGIVDVYSGGATGPNDPAPSAIITSDALNHVIGPNQFLAGQDDVLPLAVTGGSIFVANPVTNAINVFPTDANGNFPIPPRRFHLDPVAYPGFDTPIAIAVGPAH